MENLVRLYEEVAPRNWCEAQIELFEDDVEQHQIQDCGSNETLTQINMLHSPDTRWKTVANELVNYIMPTIEEYKKDFADATGIRIDGKPDKSAALMSFGLALMQKKAGKGFSSGSGTEEQDLRQDPMWIALNTK